MTEARPSELLLVIAASKPWSCAHCQSKFGRGEFLTMDDDGPLCLPCADLGHLAFLPRGDAALTRRARKVSRLSAVVVQWSRTRKRYERQGVLAESEAIAPAAQFPNCTRERALRIAGHAGARSSGRIGRTSAGRTLDADAVRLAVIAAIRHEDTRYEDLLMSGVPRAEARDIVRNDIDRIIAAWAPSQ